MQTKLQSNRRTRKTESNATVVKRPDKIIHMTTDEINEYLGGQEKEETEMTEWSRAERFEKIFDNNIISHNCVVKNNSIKIYLGLLLYTGCHFSIKEKLCL